MSFKAFSALTCFRAAQNTSTPLSSPKRNDQEAQEQRSSSCKSSVSSSNDNSACVGEEEVCWICLEGHACTSRQSSADGTCQHDRTSSGSSASTASSGSVSQNDLYQPCDCPRYAHRQCLARWRLHQAGRSEHQACRFCAKPWSDDWREALTPQELTKEEVQVEPYMAVVYNGKVHKIRVKPGAGGQSEFRQQVRALFGLPPDCDFDVTFECRAPVTSERLMLRGIDAFEAAHHCAAVAAAERMRGKTIDFLEPY